MARCGRRFYFLPSTVSLRLSRSAAFPCFGLGAEVAGADIELADGEAGFAQELEGAGDESAEGEYASGEGENFQRADQTERVEGFHGQTNSDRSAEAFISSKWRLASSEDNVSAASKLWANSRVRCVAIARRLLELSPMSAVALVSMAGATINERAAKWLTEEVSICPDLRPTGSQSNARSGI